jgi:hypothetical protein
VCIQLILKIGVSDLELFPFNNQTTKAKIFDICIKIFQKTKILPCPMVFLGLNPILLKT